MSANSHAPVCWSVAEPDRHSFATAEHHDGKRELSLTTEPTPTDQGSHLIRRILTPAIRLWLNTQVEKIENLTIAIESSDRQLLGGYIPLAQVSASEVVYRGLHLGSIHVVAESIRTNGLRIFRGEAFNLLEPLPIEVSLTLTEENLNHSLQSPLLARAIDEFMQDIFAGGIESWLEKAEPSERVAGDAGVIRAETPPKDADGKQHIHLANPQISLRSSRLLLCGMLMRGAQGNTGGRADSLNQQSLPLRLDTGLVLKGVRTLTFHDPQLVVAGIAVEETAREGRSPWPLNSFTIDLGDTTELSTLSLENQGLTCQGRITVMP